jgi:hypothetical protein
MLEKPRDDLLTLCGCIRQFTIRICIDIVENLRPFSYNILTIWMIASVNISKNQIVTYDFQNPILVCYSVPNNLHDRKGTSEYTKDRSHHQSEVKDHTISKTI